MNQCPSMKKGLSNDEDNGPMTPPGSPPHESYSSIEGEGEAVFAGKPISRKSPVRKSPSHGSASDEKLHPPPAKRQKRQLEAIATEGASSNEGKDERPLQNPPPPPPKTDKVNHEKSSLAPPKHPPPPPPKGLTPSAPPPPPPPKGGLQKQQNPGNQAGARPRPPPRSTPHAPPPKPPPGQQTALSSSSRRMPPLNQTTASLGVSKPPPPRQNAPTKPPGALPWQQVNKKAPPLQQIDMQSQEKKPSVDLPPGWMCVWSKSQKRWYFFDTKTNKSVWQWPPPKG